jgi:hypothetical protein
LLSFRSAAEESAFVFSLSFWRSEESASRIFLLSFRSAAEESAFAFLAFKTAVILSEQSEPKDPCI